MLGPIVHSPQPAFSETVGNPVYSPGVKVGDWWEYGSIDVQCGFLCPREIRELQEVRSIYSTVEEVLGDNVTIKNQVTFTNETTRTYALSGNVETGKGNLTYQSVYYLIAGGLFFGQPIHNSFDAPTINSTHTTQVAGLPRLANFLIQFGSIYGVQYTSSQGWDQEKGVLVEAWFSTGTGLSVHISLTDGIWLYSPGFGISLGSSSVTLESGENRNVIVTITSRGGWKGEVNLTVTVHPDGPQLSLTPMTLDIPDYGQATSTLTISTPKDMPSGTYVATVTASNQTVSRSKQLTVTATGPATPETPTPETPTPGPAGPGARQGQNAPLILGLSPFHFYTLMGTLVAVIAVAALVVFSRRNKVSAPESDADL